MAQDFQWLLAMHATASRFGNGLKPELEALLRRDLTRFGPSVSDLGRVPVSSGPAHQIATKAQLAEQGIPSIAPDKALREGRENARNRATGCLSEGASSAGVPRQSLT